jgi:hypothetical protein
LVFGPKPQSPIPNPQSPNTNGNNKFFLYNEIDKIT